MGILSLRACTADDVPFFTFSPEITGADASSEWEIVRLCVCLAAGGGRRSGDAVVMKAPGAAAGGIRDDRWLAAAMAEGREIVGGGCMGAGI